MTWKRMGYVGFLGMAGLNVYMAGEHWPEAAMAAACMLAAANMLAK